MNKVVGNIKRNLQKVSAPKVWLVTACMICLPLISNAQNSVPLSASEEALKSEFQQEMDKWILKAYEGDRDAQFKIGVLFANAQYGEPDYEQSVYWYKQAARQDHILAQYNLGHQYLVGLGVQRDEAQAMQWWLKAAKQNHPLAAFNVGRAYYLGIGLEEDQGLSRYWFERAAENGEPKSIEILEQLGWANSGQYSKAFATPNGGASAASPQMDSTGGDTSITEQTDNTASQSSNVEPLSTGIQEPSANNIEEPSATDIEEPSATDIEEPSATDIGEPSAKDIREPSATNDNDASVVKVEQSSAEEMQKASAAKTQESTIIDNERASDEQWPSTSVQPIADQELASIDQTTIADAVSQEPSNVDETSIRESASAPQEPISSASPLAVYTNPAVRSVLIAILDDREGLNAGAQNSRWTQVTRDQGFPVWVHRDFIRVSGEKGTMTGDRVNARSVPIVTKGTVVGRLNQGERVRVLDKRDDWFRVLSPSRFKAWAKTEDFNNAATEDAATVKSTEASNDKTPTNVAVKSVATYESNNDWLFSQPADHYTLQLASFDDPAKVTEFLKRKKFQNNKNLRQFTSNNRGIEWTYFLYGSYANEDLAKQTRVAIDQRLAWVRSFGRLQQNRCLAWKKQIPPPRALNKYCVQ